MKYVVNYTARVIKDIEVDASNEAEAERMVMDGEIDYNDAAIVVDEEIVVVNNIMEAKYE